MLEDHPTEIELPDGRRLTAGQEFTVPRRGRFRFKYAHPNGDITCFGGRRDPNRWQVRSFRPEDVGTIHRDRTIVRSKSERDA